MTKRITSAVWVIEQQRQGDVDQKPTKSPQKSAADNSRCPFRPVENGTTTRSTNLTVPSPALFRARVFPSPGSSNLMVPITTTSSSIGGTSVSSSGANKSRIFPSTRFFIALLLCFCYVSIGISTSNISSAVICMVRKDEEKYMASTATPAQRHDDGVNLMERRIGSEMDMDLAQQQHASAKECAKNEQRKSEVQKQSCHDAEKLDWTSTEQGLVFAGQNVGSLLMLFTGRQADRLNSKWTICFALLLLVISNAALPFVAPIHFVLAILARVLTGVSDALLQPSTSSLITRWFPPKERPFAIGLITGGRQIGTILITPLSGLICENSAGFWFGWHSIFFLSATVGLAILLIWLLLSADKPSKHFLTSEKEKYFVEQKIAEEKLGKRTEKRPVPWAQLARCKPFYAGVAALICHEYPLVIMLQLLSKYIDDLYQYGFFQNGLLCALPIAVLFISKTLSASLASFIQARKNGRFTMGRTPLVKLCNGVGSLGLGVCVILVPVLNKIGWNKLAFGLICLANAFAGLHTPGVQTALLQIAPAFTGIITGIAFGCVAVASICNKIISSTIIKDRSIENWTVVFWISGIIALLPVFFFTIWGSADRQPWASTGKKQRSTMSGRGKAVGKKAENGEVASGGGTKNIGGRSNLAINGGEPIRKKDEEEGRRKGQEVEDEEEVEEVEDEDDTSAEYEPDAAVASALRLQMFLQDPEGPEGGREGGGGSADGEDDERIKRRKGEEKGEDTRK